MGEPQLVLHHGEREHRKNDTNDRAPTTEDATPPSRTIVMTVNVKPVAVSARALESREVRMTPANAATVPERTKSQVLSRPTRMPEKRAASGSYPRRKCAVRRSSRWSTTPKITAMIANTAKGQGIGVPGMVPNPKSLNSGGKLLTASGPSAMSAKSPEERERAQSHDKRWQPGGGHEEPVDQASDGAHDDH